jgi:hypothetical protein
MQVEHNPVVVVDNQGNKVFNDEKNLRGEVNSRIIAIDSRVRDRARYPSANNFKVLFEEEYHGVYSIELLSAIIPIPTNGAGVRDNVEKYVVMTLDTGSKLENLEGAQSTSGSGTFYTPVFDGAFAVIPLINNLPIATDNQATYWERDQMRFIRRFKGKKETIKSMTIQLHTVDNASFSSKTKYQLDDEPGAVTDPKQNVFFLFEVVSQG